MTNSKSNQPYPSLDWPGDLEKPQGEVVLWRYLDLPKLLSLLHTKAIHFCRADKLVDPLECIYPDHLAAGYLEPDELKRYAGKHGAPKPNVEDRIKWSKDAQNINKRTIWVSCWFAQEMEAFGMWTTYSSNKAGVAIRSTVDRLNNAFGNCSIFKVIYYDYDRDDERVPIGDYRYPFYYKPHEFRDEREVRATLDISDARIAAALKSESSNLHSFRLDVDLNDLIDEVRLAPGIDDWQELAVRDLIKTYGLNAEVNKSTLSRPSLFAIRNS